MQFLYLGILATVLIVCLHKPTEGQIWPEKQHSKAFLFFLSSISCAVTAITAQQIYLIFHQSFGAGDTRAFLFWSVPFCVGTGLIAIAIGATRCGSTLRHVLSVVVGLVDGFLWTSCVASLLGPWFMTFSFPVGYFWMLGASLGLLFGSMYVSKRNG